MSSNPRARDPTLPRRRQNNSCDNCRNGKRRCDVQVRVDSAPAADGMIVSQLSSCTNCKRWKKRCTVEWIRSREEWKQTNAPRKERTQVFDIPAESAIFNVSTSQTWCQGVPTLPPNDFLQNSNLMEVFPECYSMNIPPFDLSQNSEGVLDSPVEPMSHVLATDPQTDPVLAGTETMQCWRNDECPESAGLYGLHTVCPDSSDPQASEWDEYSSPSTRLTRPIKRTQTDDLQLYAWQNNVNSMPGRPPSPFSAQLLSEDWNRLSIKKGLLKIYHDSMEGALSCWLTERNCPYSSQVFDGREVWGPSWANRIVKRVCELDKAYCKTGALPHKDQQEASKVLNLVVLAFASQWSQTGERSNSRLPTASMTPSGYSCFSHKSSNSTLQDDPFSRDMQKTLWYQASKALSDASDNKSFRVIFAGILFSLAQRPVDSTEVLQDIAVEDRGDFASLFKILDLDGAPICLDVALRKLLDHQRSMNDDATGVSTLQDFHKETFGLLCWLAVMFDTLSAAVNRRTFAVCDEDSNFDSINLPCEPIPDPTARSTGLEDWSRLAGVDEQSTSPLQDIWGDYFLKPTSRAGDTRNQHTRWPCSYQDAASCLTDAAPVKVLLFRRVAHLQNLSYRRVSGCEVENALEAVMQVYTHWNDTYGRFIEDCNRHHEELPARIQSWYILLAGHWNLAVLILSDVLQKLDDRQLTLPSQRCGRKAIDFTMGLKTRAAFAVSDLGRCSQYGEEDLTFSQSPDFHHAVNKAALLTEPWTTVLVRSFGYAGAFLARQVLLQSEPALLVDANEVRKRLQYCIDALWLLGKKSDMALCAAQVLRQSLPS